VGLSADVNSLAVICRVMCAPMQRRLCRKKSDCGNLEFFSTQSDALSMSAQISLRRLGLALPVTGHEERGGTLMLIGGSASIINPEYFC
jgi:hypothetical protein